MPNIIVLEEDSKIAHEINTFITEMGEEYTVQTFASSEDFLAKYTPEDLSEKDPALLNAKHLIPYSLENIQHFKTLKFSEAAPFEGKSVQVTINKELKPEATTSVLFQQEAEAFSENKEIWIKILEPSSLERFRAITAKVSENDTPGKTVLVFKNENNYWLIGCLVKKNGEKLSLEMSNISPVAKKVIAEAFKEKSKKPEDKTFPIINLIIFRDVLCDTDAHSWVSKIRDHLKKHKLFPEKNHTRFIITKYEEEGLIKTKYASPFIEDMICMPIDRLIFKQKIEICINLPEFVSPSYLFSQEINMDVELSKKVFIEKLNDIGLAIANPVPLKEGISSFFYFQLPEEEQLLKMATKVSRSVPHPKEKDKHLVYFDFFGAEKEENLKVKSFLRSKNDYQELLSIDEEDFTFNEENIFLTEEDKRVKTVALIIPDPELLKVAAGSINENFQQIKVLQESTFYEFHKKYLSTQQPIPLETSDLFAEKLNWRINLTTHDLAEIVTPFEEDDTICGHKAKDIFDKSSWKDLFNKDEQVISTLEMAIRKLEYTKEENLLLEIKHTDKQMRTSFLELKYERGYIDIFLSPPTADMLKTEALKSLEAIVISSQFISGEHIEWFEELQEQVKEKKLNPQNKEVKIIVVASPEETEKKKALYLQKPMSAMITTPLETRILNYHISRLTQCHFTKFNPENMGTVDFRSSGYAAKPIQLKQLSEYGTTVSSPHPLSIGSSLFFHTNIFDKAPNGNLFARVYSVEPDPNEEGFYLCHFLYFGINDNFLKFTRNWIRENYAAKKQV